MKNFKTIGYFIQLSFIALWICGLSGLKAADYHVSVNGNNGNDGSSGRPWRTIQHAVSRVAPNQGHRIIIAAGTYVEGGALNIPSGTTIIGAGTGRTIIVPGGGLRRAEQPYIALGYSLMIIRGSATIENLTLHGQDKNGASGIWVENASNVRIRNVEVREFFSNGICLQNSRNITVEDVHVTDCSWASSAWVGKGFFLQDVRDATIRRIRVVEREQRGNKGGGNAFGILPREGSVLENILVEDSYFEVHPTGIWNSGRAPNIVVEFWGRSIIRNVTLRGNEFRNGTLSFAIKKNQQNVNAQPFGFLFEENRIINGTQYPIELSCDNSIFQNNYIQAGSGYIFKNWEKEQERYEKLTIQNNVVEWNVGAGWPTTFIGSYGGYKDLVVRNNTLYARGSNGFSFIDMYNPNKFGNISENFLVEDNIVYREAGNITGFTYPRGFVRWLNDDYSNPHTIRNATVRGNIFWNFPAQDNGQHPNNRQENVRFTRSGAKPFPYYSQSTGKGADFDVKFSAPNPITPTEEEPEEEVVPQKLALPIMINAGGGEYKAQNGETYLADVNFTGYSQTAQIPISISDTEDDPIYQSERYGKEFGYEFPIDNGTYDVIIHFSEIYWDGSDRRVFNMDVNGERIMEAYDIFEESGKGAAVERTIKGVEVSDEKLQIQFSTNTDHAKVSAIEIHRNERNPNTPPKFKLSAGSVALNQNFAEPVTVQVIPDPVPENERSQEVVYRLNTGDNDIADLQINPETGTITITSKPGKIGAQVFTITADDQQSRNNIATQEFRLSVGGLIFEDIPTPTGGDEVALRINAGGEAFTTADGKEFVADNTKYLSGNSRDYQTSGEVEGTENDPLYLSERWGKDFAYNAVVPNGTYQVRLHFAEIFWKGEDYRVFDILVEDGLASMTDLDIYEKVGEFAAYIVNIENVTVVDGSLSVSFSTQVDNAKLSAIEFIQTSPMTEEDMENGLEAMALRINSGSSEEMEVNGKTFMADTYFSRNSLAWANNELQEVGRTEMDAIYLTERYANRDLGNFSYNIPLDNGHYVAYLHFAEIYFGAIGGYDTEGAGKRIINGRLEGKEVFSSLDISQVAGSTNAYVVKVPVNITFDLELGASRNRPKIAAIEILQASDKDVVITEEGLNSSNFKLAQDPFENPSSRFVKIAPNPAVDQANLIMYNDFEGFFDVKVFDALGRMCNHQIIEKTREMGKYELDISNMQTGIYIIIVDINGEIYSDKLWIKR